MASDPHDDLRKAEILYNQGKISPAEWERVTDEAIARIEKKCKHSNTYIDEGKSGWIEACNDCGATVNRGSTAASIQKVGGGGCAVVAVLVLGATTPVGWALFEALRSIF